MPTVWELIREHSTAPEGSTFWEHLQAQGGGGGTYVILADGLEVDIDMEDVVVFVEPEQDFIVEVETQEFEIELDTNYTVEI